MNKQQQGESKRPRGKVQVEKVRPREKFDRKVCKKERKVRELLYLLKKK